MSVDVAGTAVQLNRLDECRRSFLSPERPFADRNDAEVCVAKPEKLPGGCLAQGRRVNVDGTGGGWQTFRIAVDEDGLPIVGGVDGLQDRSAFVRPGGGAVESGLSCRTVIWLEVEDCHRRAFYQIS